MSVRSTVAHVTAVLEAAGFIAAPEEAELLVTSAGGDPERLEALVERRLTGEPLAWITGSVSFCGVNVRVAAGVYVPRWHTGMLVQRAVARLPARGVAIDVCTGSGAVAMVLMQHRQHARVIASDIDELAVVCARSNGVDARTGDLFDPIPAELLHRADVITAVVPYVPTSELALLQRDTFTFESPLAYDGGSDGTGIVRRVVEDSTVYLKPGGVLLVEVGGRQADLLSDAFRRAGYAPITRLVDEEGDLRCIEAVFSSM